MKRPLLTVEACSGLFVFALGLLAWAAVGDLAMGTAQVMGPGYVPRVLAIVLLCSGLGMTLIALRREGTPLPPMLLRPVILVSLAVALFGLLVDGCGIVIATVVSTAVASVASPISRHRFTHVLWVVLEFMGFFLFVF
jgi:putative tricarboxylic transport membrane protein